MGFAADDAGAGGRLFVFGGWSVALDSACRRGSVRKGRGRGSWEIIGKGEQLPVGSSAGAVLRVGM